MTDYLRLRIEPDDDGTAELHAEVSSNGFSGVGSAWFDLRYLADFAKQFIQAEAASRLGLIQALGT